MKKYALPVVAVVAVVLVVGLVFDLRRPSFQRDAGEPIPAVMTWKNAEFVKIELCRVNGRFEADVWIKALPEEGRIARCHGVPGKGVFPATIDRNDKWVRAFSEHVIHPKTRQEHIVARFHLVRENDQPVDSLEWW